MPSDAAEIGLVFVVGCPRSGTTLVGEVLAVNPSALNGEESQILYLMNTWRAMLHRASPLTEPFIAAVTALVKETTVEETKARGKSIYVDHSPWHALCLPEVWDIFPHARVVHVVRNPADVVDSLRRSYLAGYRWAGATTRDRVQLWMRFVDHVESHRADPRLVEIRYEDIAADPRESLRRLVASIGWSWDERFLLPLATLHSGWTSSREPIGRVDVAGQLSLKRPDAPRPPSKRVASALAEIAAEQLARYGYAPSTTDT